MASNEILTEIEVPPVPEGSGNAFLKITRVGADISKLSAAAALERDGEICVLCRIALGAVAPVPMRVEQAEKLVIGKKIEHGLLEEVGKKAAKEIKPVSDIRSTAEYRKKTAAVLVKEVLWRAWQRATAQEL
jgi:carbon-monoxide dehydrogenase medium subunit